MKKKLIILIILILVIVIGSLLFINIKNHITQEQNNKRYEEIRSSVDKELERYLYVISPNCQPNEGTPIITHRNLVYNAGMDKEKLLDIDKKSYCKVYVYTDCVEIGKWNWKTTISCKYYQDKDYKDWDEEFPPKKIN